MGRLFRDAFAMLYAPTYQAEHKSARSSGSTQIPIPRDKALFDQVVAVGIEVTRLLDTSRDADEVVKKTLGADFTRTLGTLKRTGRGQVRPDNLKVTITYGGGGTGRWTSRVISAAEEPPLGVGAAWGEATGDLFINDETSLFINDETFFCNAPKAVWTYQLGGHPALEKWLGYRQANRTGGRPLSDAERRWFGQ